MRTEDFDRFLDGVYTDAVSGGTFKEALETVQIIFRAKAACLMLFDVRMDEVRNFNFLGSDEETNASYTEHYWQFDHRNYYTQKMPVGFMHVDGDFISEADMKHDSFYQEFLLPRGYKYSTGGTLFRSQDLAGTFALQRSTSEGPISEEERENFTRLANHMRRALELQERVAANREEVEGLSSVTNRLHQAVFVVDSVGLCHWKNALAEKLASRPGAALRLRHDRLEARLAADMATLSRLIASALDVSPEAAAILNFRGWNAALKGPTPTSMLAISVYPVPGGSGISINGVEEDKPRRAVVFATEIFMPTDRLDPAILQLLFSLTPAETELALAISDGDTLATFATSRGLSRETARTHLKHIFQKLGVNRQVDVARIVAGITARYSLAVGD